MDMGNCTSKNKVTPISQILDLYPVAIVEKNSKRSRQPFIEERMLRPQKLENSEKYIPYPLPRIGEPEE